MTENLYIGRKTIKAGPMTRLEYNQYRDWDLPDDEDGSDDGYLVEYVDGGQPNHPDHEGYISWSPKNVFEKAYKPCNTPYERLVIELNELKDKHNKLREFLISKPEQELAEIVGAKQLALMRSQCLVMGDYVGILQERMDLF